MSSNDSSSSSASNSPSSSEQPPEKKQKIEDDQIRVRNWEPLLESDEDEIVYGGDTLTDDEEDMEEYYDAVKASDGFDVPDPTGISFCGRIVPMKTLNDHSREMLSSLSVAAMKYYNELHHTNYQFQELVKANKQGCWRYVYYITFVGEIPGDNTTKIFQARVSTGTPEIGDGDHPVEVYMCREKASLDFMEVFS